jgi:hypothetical protein
MKQAAQKNPDGLRRGLILHCSLLLPALRSPSFARRLALAPDKLDGLSPQKARFRIEQSGYALGVRREHYERARAMAVDNGFIEDTLNPCRPYPAGQPIE